MTTAYFADNPFFGGNFFGDQFFRPHARGTVAFLGGDRGPPRDHVRRTRGKFQVEITAEALIELVAARHLDSDTDEMIADLRSELDARFMDWDASYIGMVLKERSRLVAERARRLAAEAKAQSDWFDRRRKTVLRMH